MIGNEVLLAGVALLGTLAALGSPILASVLMNRNAKAMKQQDWDRQDEVASRAEAAAARSASLIAEGNQAASEASRITIGKLDVIHTLGNSTLTAALQLALDGQRREVILMERLPDPDPVLIAATKAKISELEKVIESRNKAVGITSLQDQRIEAAEASQAVGVLSQPHVAPVQPLGEVTQRVLRGEPSLSPVTSTAPMTETQKTAQADAAAATVKAAIVTKAAADKTVESLKKP